MKVHYETLRDFPDAPKEVPDELLNEEWAQRNHSQSLARLNERGGMACIEILANIHRCRVRDLAVGDKWETQKCIDDLNEILKS